MIDLGMAGIPGDQVAREIRRMDPSAATVLMTGWRLGEGDPRLSAFDYHLQKPLNDLDGFREVVARAVVLHDERAGMTGEAGTA